MRIRLNLAALKQIKWHEYLTRFLLGGAITVITGLVAKHFGPVIGGLFLAFPAIFPSGATLIEKNEREKKHRAGISHTMRGRGSRLGGTQGSDGHSRTCRICRSDMAAPATPQCRGHLYRSPHVVARSRNPNMADNT